MIYMIDSIINCAVLIVNIFTLKKILDIYNLLQNRLNEFENNSSEYKVLKKSDSSETFSSSEDFTEPKIDIVHRNDTSSDDYTPTKNILTPKVTTLRSTSCKNVTSDSLTRNSSRYSTSSPLLFKKDKNNKKEKEQFMFNLLKAEN